MNCTHGVTVPLCVMLGALLLNGAAGPSTSPGAGFKAGVDAGPGVAGVPRKAAVALAAEQAAEGHAFDFYPGSWRLKGKQLKERLKGSQVWEGTEATETARHILGGAGLLTEYQAIVDGKPFRGVTLHVFNPARREWSIQWIDGARGVLDPPLTLHRR